MTNTAARSGLTLATHVREFDETPDGFGDLPIDQAGLTTAHLLR